MKIKYECMYCRKKVDVKRAFCSTPCHNKWFDEQSNGPLKEDG